MVGEGSKQDFVGGRVREEGESGAKLRWDVYLGSTAESEQ